MAFVFLVTTFYYPFLLGWYRHFWYTAWLCQLFPTFDSMFLEVGLSDFCSHPIEVVTLPSFLFILLSHISVSHSSILLSSCLSLSWSLPVFNIYVHPILVRVFLCVCVCLVVLFCFHFLETKCCCVAQTDIEFTIYSGLVLNSWHPSCLFLPA